MRSKEYLKVESKSDKRENHVPLKSVKILSKGGGIQMDKKSGIHPPRKTCRGSTNSDYYLDESRGAHVVHAAEDLPRTRSAFTLYPALLAAAFDFREKGTNNELLLASFLFAA